MTASTVDIVNFALDRLGATPIISMADVGIAATASRLYPLARRSVLQGFPWNEAITRMSIPADAETPAYGFSKSYTVPANCLRLLEVATHAEYQVEGNKILTDADAPLNIRYVYDLEDTSAYSPLLVDALSAYLAFEMCETVTQSNTKKEAQYVRYNDVLKEAKKADAAQQPPTMVENDDWLYARY